MTRNKIYKEDLMNEIINREIFTVCSSQHQNDWILLKNNSRTPIFLNTAYFNSCPSLIFKLNQYIMQIVDDNNIAFDRVAGIPYGGLPFSFGVSTITHKPHLLIRKEGPKTYGTADAILGRWAKYDTVLLLEDATVTADTALSYAKQLRDKKMNVNNIVTIIDTEQGAHKKLISEGIQLSSVFTWKGLYEQYKATTMMDENVMKTIDNFVYRKSR